jgi:hypothetical protein
MITAKNYAAQAEKDLGIFANKMELNSLSDLTRDAFVCRLMAIEIKSAIHFTMPDYGIIFDDKAQGISGNQLRLPFPLITVEYFVPVNNRTKEDHVDVKKRLFIAKELKVSIALDLGYISEINHKFFINSEYLIMVSSVYFHEASKEWTPHPYALVIPNQWDNTNQTSRRLGTNTNGTNFVAAPFNLFPNTCEMLANYVGKDKAESDGINDVAGEGAVLLELLEALSCRNVEQSIHQQASPKNEQRLKSHKLPIYETKFLTIKQTVKEYSKNGIVTNHASPRQHLRRGHIRRLESGNIWVNSCVVGDSSKGVIEKQYKFN